MVQAKMMDETAFSKIENELRAFGELIKTRQDEKQGVLNEFDKERERYKQGKISENTLASSVKKTNAELLRLDKNIRELIQKSLNLSSRMNDFLRKQEPKVFRAKESGIFLQGGAKKKVMKKKIVVKKAKISKTEIVQEMKAEKKLFK